MEPHDEVVNRTLEFIRSYNPSFIDVVPKEVLVFGTPDPIVCTFAALVTLCLSVIAISGNFLLIFLYIRHKGLRTAGHKLVINLAISNSIMHTKSWVIVVNGLSGGPLLGEWGCVSYGGLGTLAGLTEIWTIMCISYDRYRTISTPLTKSRKLSRMQINIMIAAIWIFALFFSGLPLLGINHYVSESYLLSCEFDTWSQKWTDRAYIYIMIVAAWLIPIIVIIFCYIKIFIYTYGTRSNVNSFRNISSMNGGKKAAPEADFFTIERKVASRLLIAIIIWTLGWTPFTFVALAQMLGHGHKLSKYASLLSMLFCKCSSVLNAYIYGLRLPKFRKRIHIFINCNYGSQQEHTIDSGGHNALKMLDKSRLIQIKDDELKNEKLVHAKTSESPVCSCSSGRQWPPRKNQNVDRDEIIKTSCSKKSFSVMHRKTQTKVILREKRKSRRAVLIQKRINLEDKSQWIIYIAKYSTARRWSL